MFKKKLYNRFITEGADAAIALRYLVAAAVDKLKTISSAPVGLLANLLADFFAPFAALFPDFSKKVLIL